MLKYTTLILCLTCFAPCPLVFRLGSGAGRPGFSVILIHGPSFANVTTSDSTSMPGVTGNEHASMALQTKTVREPELTHYFDQNIPILRAEYGRRLRGPPSSTALAVRDPDAADRTGKTKTPTAFLHPNRSNLNLISLTSHRNMGTFLTLIHLPLCCGVIWCVCNMGFPHGNGHGHGMERGNPQLTQG